MELSPEAQRVVEELCQGRQAHIGDRQCGPFDKRTRLVLQILRDNCEQLEAMSGQTRAKAFLGMWRTAREPAEDKVNADGQEGEERRPSSSAGRDTRPSDEKHHRWRLYRLKCQSVRGCAPYGEEIEFSFEGKSNLIYGPNGSGKSSLLGAVTWVLTGATTTDGVEDCQTASIHKLGEGSTKGRRIREWPIICTLHDSVSDSATVAECKVELELRNASGEQSLLLRRTLADGLEASTDEATWTRCADLKEHGIAGLDLQLSLTAPRVLSRQIIESASDVVGMLSMMLGYDSLVRIGELGRVIRPNLTTLENSMRGHVDTLRNRLCEKLKTVVEGMPESEEREEIGRILEEGQSAEVIKKAKEKVKARLIGLNQSIREELGLGDLNEAELDKLGDRLAAVLSRLESGFKAVFPKLCELDADREGRGEVWVVDLEKRLFEFLDGAKRRIAARVEWWREEQKAGSKAELLLKAAEYYDEQRGECPVCDLSIKGQEVEAQLKRLKQKDKELQRKVCDFFGDLVAELDSVLAEKTREELIRSPHQRILDDWDSLGEEAGESLKVVIGQFDEYVKSIAQAARIDSITAPEVFGPEVEKEFSEQGARFVEAVSKARTALANLKWSVASLRATREQLHAVTTGMSVEGVRRLSLLGVLEKGKTAAREIKPLRVALTGLDEAMLIMEGIAAKENDIADLSVMKDDLDNLKRLKEGAEAETKRVLEEIGEEAAENWKQLYPEVPSGLQPSRVVMERGKALGVLLEGVGYEVEGQYFANAGLQRAMGLSLLCALLQKHPGGLDFVILDDPILSLDEEHREGWSDKLLSPMIQRGTQVVLATHQRQYVNNCKQAFATGAVTELNHRDEKGRVTWRPGDALEQCEATLAFDWRLVPNQLRRYCENVLLTLQTYSDHEFYSPHSFSKSVQRYAQLSGQTGSSATRGRQICTAMQRKEVDRVLNPGSHALTDADLTKSMVRECLDILKKEVDGPFRREVTWLEQLRANRRRGTVVRTAASVSAGGGASVSEVTEIRLAIIGRAAARGESWVVDNGTCEGEEVVNFDHVVCVAGESLEPVARRGQYVLLDTVERIPVEGDLVAVETSTGERFLRRVSFMSDMVLLQGVNPVKHFPTIGVAREHAVMHKIIGVLYGATGLTAEQLRSDTDEWRAAVGSIEKELQKLKAIIIEGDSMDPIARKGQKILVRDGQSPSETPLEQGGLAAIETDDDQVGYVVKRVYHRETDWILVSPNPVMQSSPVIVAAEKIRRVWPLHGMLFESGE